MAPPPTRRKTCEVQTLRLKLEKIVADPRQPRKHFDEAELRRLADSIEKHGLLQPILVRPAENGFYMIVHGERRYRACKIAGIVNIHCGVRNDLSEEQIRDIQLTENLQRNNLSDIELALEFQRRRNEGKTDKQIAEDIGKTRSFVTQRIQLLTLPKQIQDRILTKEISFSNARQLLSIKDVAVRSKVAEQITDETTVMQTITLVRQSESVTQVTTFDVVEQITVKELEIYNLMTSRETVTAPEFLAAVGKDLARIRGEQP